MKLACLISFALLLNTGSLAAQGQGRNATELTRVPPSGVSAAQPATPTNAETRPQISRSCPVVMRAQHMADGEMVKTGTAKPHGIGQQLRLTLVAPDSRRVARARLTIRGLSPKGRTVETLGKEDDDSDAVNRQMVSFTAGPDRHDFADLWASGMTAVQSIEISSVTYSDGSTWRYGGNMTCRVTPDGIMLTDNHSSK